MRADLFGAFGLILGVLGVGVFYFAGPALMIEKIESLEFAGAENGAFILVFMCGSAACGIIGMIVGEIVSAISEVKKDGFN